jgi:hypothetical protein
MYDPRVEKLIKAIDWVLRGYDACGCPIEDCQDGAIPIPVGDGDWEASECEFCAAMKNARTVAHPPRPILPSGGIWITLAEGDGAVEMAWDGDKPLPDGFRKVEPDA